MSWKHTPGPWRVENGADWPFDIEIKPINLFMERVAYSSEQESLEDVRNAVGFPHDQREEVARLVAEQEANAHLISAAPDMYPLVELLASLPITDRADDIPVFGFDDVYITHGHVRAARAAIAKARGQA